MNNSTINNNKNNSPITMNKQFIPREQHAPAPVFSKNESTKEHCIEINDNNAIAYSEIRYCVGFKTKNYMTTEKSTFINKLIQNENKHECICELLDCSGNTYYHPYFDIEHYDNDTTIEFNIDTIVEFIFEQFGGSRNDMALLSDIRENVKQSYHCVLFTK